MQLLNSFLQTGVVALLLLCTRCCAFNVVQPSPLFASASRRLQLRTPSLQQRQISLLQKSFVSSQRYMSAEEPSEDSTTETIDNEDGGIQKRDSDKGKSGITRKGVLLAVPLFCKFIIVLVIKFATDLVVFPLLLLYRLVRLTKRRFLKLIGKDGTSAPKAPSGESP